MSIVLWGIVFWSGFLIGCVFMLWLSSRVRDVSGTIIVDKDHLSEKTVYSLVLDDYPEKLAFKKEVVFKVETSGKSSVRK